MSSDTGRWEITVTQSLYHLVNTRRALHHLIRCEAGRSPIWSITFLFANPATSKIGWRTNDMADRASQWTKVVPQGPIERIIAITRLISKHIAGDLRQHAASIQRHLFRPRMMAESTCQSLTDNGAASDFRHRDRNLKAYEISSARSARDIAACPSSLLETPKCRKRQHRQCTGNQVPFY